MTNLNHYQLLGIDPNATRHKIRSAYRKALRRYHPDTNEGKRDGEQMLLRVLTAGRILSDPKLRAHYDRRLNRDSSSAPSDVKKNATQHTVSSHQNLWKMLIDRGRTTIRKFFTVDAANAAEQRAANLRQRKAPGFSFHLYRALSRNHSRRYQRGADGIYRRTSKKRKKGRTKNWGKRTAV